MILTVIILFLIITLIYWLMTTKDNTKPELIIPKISLNAEDYIYIESNGTARELDVDEIKYLNTKFSPMDGARPYVKCNYDELTPDKKIDGFLERVKLPKNVIIK